MSKYSGKADFFDHLWASSETEEEAFNKFNGTKIYMCQPLPDDFSFKVTLKEKINIPETYYKKIEYSFLRDLIPLYPHLIAFSYYDKADSNNSIVCLSSESFVDIEERERLEFYLKYTLRAYNKCKRKKVEFNINDIVNELCWHSLNKEAIYELVRRVKEKGKKASIDNIHLTIHEYYRKQLTDEMLKHGLNPVDYGYERFVEN